MTVVEGMDDGDMEVEAGVGVIVMEGIAVGAGGGGGVNTGSALVSPVSVAKWPHSQQVCPGRFGFLMIQ